MQCVLATTCLESTQYAVKLRVCCSRPSALLSIMYGSCVTSPEYFLAEACQLHNRAHTTRAGTHTRCMPHVLESAWHVECAGGPALRFRLTISARHDWCT